MPRSGQYRSADASDSCIASSARSNDPASRMSVAMMRPDSSRKTRSTTVLALLISRLEPQRTDFDTAVTSAAAARDARSPFDGLIQVLALQNVIPGELFLRFGERAIGDQRFPVLHADSGRRAGGLQRRRSVKDAAARGFFHSVPMPGEHLPRLFGRHF